MPDNISLIPKDYKEEGFNFGAIFSKMGVFIVGLVILSLLVYGGLFFYAKSLTSKLNETVSKIEEINKKRDTDFEGKVVSLERALKTLKILLKDHLYWSNLFLKFEKLVVPQVSFADFSATTVKDGSVSLILQGNASSYTYLAKQMVSFSQEKLISNMEVSGITLGTEGGIEFNLNINFLKDVLIVK